MGKGSRDRVTNREAFREGYDRVFRKTRIVHEGRNFFDLPDREEWEAEQELEEACREKDTQ